MSTEKNAENKHRGSKLKVLSWILAGIFVFVILIFFAIPLYLSSSGGTNMLLGKINKSMDGQVQMEDFSVGWFGGVKVENLMFTDEKGQTSVKVGSVQAHPSYASLLGGKIKLGKTVIQSPQIDIKVADQDSKDGGDDYSIDDENVGKSFALPVDQMDLELRDGRVTIELPGQHTQKVSFTNIASNVLLADAGKNSKVDVSMQVADGNQKGGEIAAKGSLAADKNWTLKDGDFNVTISKLQLSSLKPLFALAGQEEMDMSGELNADAEIKMVDNEVEKINAGATITDFAQGSGQQRIAFEQPVDVTAIVGKADDELSIEKLTVASQFCNVGCAGTMESMGYRIDADLAQTQRFVKQFAPMDMGLEGKLIASGRMKLSEEVMAFSGKGSFSRLAIQNDDVKTDPIDGDLNYDLNFDKAAQLLSVRSVNLDSDSMGILRIKNMRMPLGDDKASGLALDMNADLNLEKTLALAQVFSPKLTENQISGHLKAAAKIETTGSRIRFLAQSTSVDQLKIIRKDSEPFVQDRVTLDGDIIVDTTDKTIDVRTLDLQGSQGESLIKVTKGKVEKKVGRKQTEVKGDFEAEYDWKTVSTLAPVEGLSVKGKRKSAIQFSSNYPTDKPDQMIPNLDATGNIGFDSASYKGLNFDATELDVKVEKGLMNFTIPKTTVNEGTMQFAGWVDLKEEPKFLRVKNARARLDMVHINDTVTSNYLQYTNPMFADAVSTQGVASLKIDEMEIPLSKGHKSATNMKANLNIESMSMRPGKGIGGFLKLMNAFGVDAASWGADIAVLPTEILLTDGVLSYDSMKIVMGKRQFDFSGRIELDNKLTMSVILPWTLTGDTLTPEQQSQRGARIPISGSLTKPEFKMESMIRQQGEQLIRDQIRKGLEGLFD